MLIPSWSPEEKEVAAETLGITYTDTDTNNNPEQWYITIAEELARNTLLLVVNNNKERQEKQQLIATAIKISGVTVGIVNHPRAAPGLESCLDAIMIGSKDRRRLYGSSSSSSSNGINDNLKTNNINANVANANTNTNKSCIGIVCNCLEDLIGFDEECETDAVQNVFQSRSVATMMIKPQTETETGVDDIEPIIEFAKRAHKYWRVHIAGLSADEPTTTIEEEIENEKNDSNTATTNNNKYDDIDDNKLVTLMVWITVLVIGYISYYIGNKT